jgi:ribosomal protein S18 acetylase RimI-like enzyme
MTITYNDQKKDLPVDQLRQLFYSVGWMQSLTEESDERLKGFIQPWIHSSLVVSAWYSDRLVGAVRVLSDTIFRSVIYDLLVLPELQNKGIGKELIKRCIEHFPNSEWLVYTTKEISGYYEKIGFTDSNDVFLTIPCRLFS